MEQIQFEQDAGTLLSLEYLQEVHNVRKVASAQAFFKDKMNKSGLWQSPNSFVRCCLTVVWFLLLPDD